MGQAVGQAVGQVSVEQRLVPMVKAGGGAR